MTVLTAYLTSLTMQQIQNKTKKQINVYFLANAITTVKSFIYFVVMDNSLCLSAVLCEPKPSVLSFTLKGL